MTATAKKSTAEMGLERLLRPAWNFERDYDGQSGALPIVFTWPTPQTPLAAGTADLSVLDDEARVTPPPTGISPVLAKFVPVSIGSTMLFFIPIVPSINPPPVDHWLYVWRIVFRFRSAADWVTDKRRRKPYQIGKTTFACRDTRTDVVPNRAIPIGGALATDTRSYRYLMPVTAEAVIYGKPEQDVFPVWPPGAYMPNFGTVMPDAAAIPATPSMVARCPLYPGTIAAGGNPVYMDYQQGVLDPLFVGITPTPITANGFRPTQATHLTKWIKACGNEFLVECYKFQYDDPDQPQTFTPRNWDFNVDPVTFIPQMTGEDYPFSAMFGLGALGAAPTVKEPSPYTGVRVVSGLAPL